MKNDRVGDPAPAGQILGEELEARAWTQADFASVLGRPVQFVSEIVNGKKEITRESAAQIGAALGQSVETWLDLQDLYLLSEQAKDVKTQATLSDVRRRARLNQMVPLSVLQKRGVLTGTEVDELERQVMELFGLNTIDDEPKFLVRARRSNQAHPATSVQRAWAACARREATQWEGLPRYSKLKLADLAAELPTLLTEPARFQDLPDRFAAAGVILIYVEALPGSKIDGCAFKLGAHPVVALSGRGKRLDKVLWTLLHEVAHVLLGHITAELVVETLDDGEDQDDVEIAANKRAGELLFPRPMPAAPLRVNAGWVESVAAEFGVAPIVVVGQLQDRRLLDWRTTLARDAPSVTDVLATW